MHISLSNALNKLEQSGNLFTNVFSHGSLEVELYKPENIDLQQPHTRDELYIVISGNGEFYCDGQTINYGAGDFLFVPAGKEHRFNNFSNDFITWVLFYGPEGGEK